MEVAWNCSSLFACCSMKFVPDAPESAFITSSLFLNMCWHKGGTEGLILFSLYSIKPVPPCQMQPEVLPPILLFIVASSLC